MVSLRAPTKWPVQVGAQARTAIKEPGTPAAPFATASVARSDASRAGIYMRTRWMRNRCPTAAARRPGLGPVCSGFAVCAPTTSAISRHLPLVDGSGGGQIRIGRSSVQHRSVVHERDRQTSFTVEAKASAD